jgi:hypothetical protein
MTAAPTLPASSAPIESSLWWGHLLSTLLAVVAFVGVAIHPGWQPPIWAAQVVAVAAPAMVLASTVVLMVLHHKFDLYNLSHAFSAAYRSPALAQAKAAVKTFEPELPAVLEARFQSLQHAVAPLATLAAALTTAFPGFDAHLKAAETAPKPVTAVQTAPAPPVATKPATTAQTPAAGLAQALPDVEPLAG